MLQNLFAESILDYLPGSLIMVNSSIIFMGWTRELIVIIGGRIDSVLTSLIPGYTVAFQIINGSRSLFGQYFGQLLISQVTTFNNCIQKMTFGRIPLIRVAQTG
jgi:hypothetical protein